MKWRVIPDDSCVKEVHAKIIENSDRVGVLVRIKTVEADFSL